MPASLDSAGRSGFKNAWPRNSITSFEPLPRIIFSRPNQGGRPVPRANKAAAIGNKAARIARAQRIASIAFGDGPSGFSLEASLMIWSGSDMEFARRRLSLTF
jgi:hypothetical protein